MLKHIFWSEAELFNGLDRLAYSIGGKQLARNTLTENLEDYAKTLGVEAQPILTNYGDLQKTLRQLIPGLIEFTHEGHKNYVFICASHRNQLSLLLKEGGSLLCNANDLAELIYKDRGYQPDVNTELLLGELGLRGHRLMRVKTLMAHQQLAATPIQGLWSLRPHVNQGLKVAASHAKLARYALGFTLAHLCERLALLAGISLIGYGVTQDSLSESLVISWLLIMLSHLAFNALGQSCQMQLDVRLGIIIKRHLQHSALGLSPEIHASKGPAQLLGQAMEADGLQSNALPGVFMATNAVTDLLLGLCIALAMQQWLLSALLIVFVAACTYLITKFNSAYHNWAKHRKQLSHLTIEHMQGNRTRLIQSTPNRRHKEEEKLLLNYWAVSTTMDKHALWLQSIIPGLWLISASAILCSAIFFALLTLIQLAALLGVILLVWQAWHSIADSCQQLARSWNAWLEIQNLLKHASKENINNSGEGSSARDKSTLSVNQVSFSYNKHKQVLHSVNINLQQGKRYLLQGESGSGKSSLLSILAGQTCPQQGWLLYNDRDLQTLGHNYWRKKICWVPQYHENYLFSGTLLFNLLIARTWPPSQKDTDDALDVCKKLGLMPLLQKMPAGILQSVGEMGWQLSQGERSRVYLARAMLQNADFLLLDESLGALDPKTSLNILASLQAEPSSVLLCMHP